MSVDVNFKRKVGSINIKCNDNKYHTLYLFEGNCDLICCTTYKENGEEYHNLAFFISDKNHMKNMVNGVKNGQIKWIFPDTKCIKFNIKYVPNWEYYAKVFVEQGCKVELYSKEIKGE